MGFPALCQPSTVSAVSYEPFVPVRSRYGQKVSCSHAVPPGSKLATAPWRPSTNRMYDDKWLRFSDSLGWAEGTRNLST